MSQRLHSLERPLFGGAGFALGFVATIVAGCGGAVLATVFGWSARPIITFVLLAATVTVVSAVTALPGAVGTASTAWGVYSGFVLHQYGELRWTESDRAALETLMGLALVVGLLCTAARPRSSRPRTFPTVPDVIPSWLEPAIAEVSHPTAADRGRTG